MLGTLKFLLSLAIVLSHAHIYLKVPGFTWFHHGVAAVIGFYILSGYITKFTLDKKYHYNNTKIFYLDRFIRIFPQYYFYLIAAFLFLIVTGYIPLHITLSNVATNLLVFPINLDHIVSVSFFEKSYDALIPPTWYLGTELQFYLLAPILFRYPKIKNIALGLAFITFLLAAFGIIDTRLYGSRLLPTVLLFYITGEILYNLHIKRQISSNRLYLIISWVTAVIIFLFLKDQGKIQLAYNGPVLLGYIFLMPLSYLLISLSIRSKVDDFLGKVSYGVYLNHFLLLWVFDYFKFFPNSQSLKIASILIASCTLSCFSYWLIEQNLSFVRTKIRKLAAKHTKV
ncbi:MAG: acyltransferase family protein [Patescibacteria group bacterium]|jgi:peptidoglycan/LPS O-acetylase OafA/YrhL